MESCRGDRASIKSCVNSHRRIGKNSRRPCRFVHPKFSPQSDTSLIVDPKFPAAAWCAVDGFSKRRRRRVCLDKNNRRRASIHRVLQGPGASHAADLAQFLADDNCWHHRTCLARSRLQHSEIASSRRGPHHRNVKARNRHYPIFGSRSGRFAGSQSTQLPRYAQSH